MVSLLINNGADLNIKNNVRYYYIYILIITNDIIIIVWIYSTTNVCNYWRYRDSIIIDK